MPAVHYSNLSAVCDNLRYQIEDTVGLEIVVAAIASLQVLNPAWLVNTLTEDDRNEMLKKLTACTVGTDVNVNCYPLGYVTQLLFDLDGHPIP